MPIQPVEHVPCHSWGAVWLTGDGKVARPFPGREDEAEEEWAGILDENITFERVPGVPKVIAPRDAGAAKKPWWKFW